MELTGWGKYPARVHRGVLAPATLADVQSCLKRMNSHVLPRGNGRSYGDVCLNEGGYLILNRWLDHFVDFDPQTGRICCEPGVTFDDLLKITVPHGWFLPVTPGTRFVTLGGAIANDIHGKNHHVAGSFGKHLQKITLLRSNGEIIECSPEENARWFQATVGGLGLTGMIIQAEIKLKKIPGPMIEVEAEPFTALSEFLRLSRLARSDWEYTVGWLDAANLQKFFGRGVLFKGRHIATHEDGIKAKNRLSLTIPFDLPGVFPLRHLVKWYNRYYFRTQKGRRLRYLEDFFYPLDTVLHWNRLYGHRGLIQWQALIPEPHFLHVSERILGMMQAHRLPSYLVVVKDFGLMEPIGMLSFPGPGITIAMDFPNTGEALLRMLDRFDALVLDAGGRIYPAKDARMQGEVFRASYPRYATFRDYIDPKFSSSFWKRVMT